MTSDMCILGRGTHITRNCTWVGKTHSTRDMCKAHSTRDMSKGGTRILRATHITVMSQ